MNGNGTTPSTRTQLRTTLYQLARIAAVAQINCAAERFGLIDQDVADIRKLAQVAGRLARKLERFHEPTLVPQEEHS